MMMSVNEENLFATIITGSLLLLAVMFFAGCSLFSLKTGVGILAGGGISILNFIWLRNVLQRIIGLLPPKPNMYAHFRFIARMTVSGLILYAVITSGWITLGGLLAGLSIIIINIILLSVYFALRAGG